MSKARAAHTTRKRILSLGLAVGAVSLLLLGHTVWRLYGWSLPELHFHESWPPDRREELQELGDLLRHRLLADYRLRDAAPGAAKAAPLGLDRAAHWIADLRADLRARMAMSHALRPIYGKLRRAAADGRSDDLSPIAHLAARMSKPALVRELVLRGANPNAVFMSADRKWETIFQASIICSPPVPEMVEERAPQAERLRLLVWLLEHGAEANANHDMTLPLAVLADSLDSQSDDDTYIPGAIIECLLDHGLKLESETDRKLVCLILSLEGALPTMQRILRKGYLDIADPAVLSELVTNAATCSAPDAAAKTRWALNLGADPQQALAACWSQLQINTNTEQAEEMANFSAALSVLEALLERGIAPSAEDAAHLLSLLDEPQKTLLCELLQRHAS